MRGPRCAYLALVALTGATNGDTLANDQLQNPLEQTRVFGVLEDALDDVEPVRSEGDTECLCERTSASSHQHLAAHERRCAAGKCTQRERTTHLLVLAVALTPLKHALDDGL